MNNRTKGLIVVAMLGLGVGLVISKVLSQKSVDDVKGDIKENVYKVKKVVKENVEKVKDSFEDYNKENTSNMKFEI
ncbi:MAG: YtxH-like protein [uncultured Clostridium sp.]